MKKEIGRRTATPVTVECRAKRRSARDPCCEGRGLEWLRLHDFGVLMAHTPDGARPAVDASTTAGPYARALAGGVADGRVPRDRADPRDRRGHHRRRRAGDRRVASPVATLRVSPGEAGCATIGG